MKRGLRYKLNRAKKAAQNFSAGDKVKYVGNNPTPYAKSGDAGIVDNAYTPGTAGDKVPVEWNGGGFDIVSESEIEKVGAFKIIHAFNAGDKVKYVGNRDTPYAKSGDEGVVDNAYTPNTAGDNVPVEWNGGGFDIVSKGELEKISHQKETTLAAQNFVAGDKVKLVRIIGRQYAYANVGDTGVVDSDYTPGTAGDKVPIIWDAGGADIVSKEELEKLS